MQTFKIRYLKDLHGPLGEVMCKKDGVVEIPITNLDYMKQIQADNVGSFEIII